MREQISLYSIYLKDLTTHLSSPLLPAIMGIFLFVSGFFFFNSMAFESLLATRIAQFQYPDGMVIDDLVLQPAFSNMVLLIIMMVPLISLRLRPEEEVNKEEKLLKSNFKILLGKYLAGLSILMGILAATSLLPALTALVTSPNWGLIISSYSGLALLGGTILAIRAFASSLTEYRVIATALTFGFIIIFWSIGWYSAIFPGDCLGAILEELSLANHLSPFLKGIVSLRDIAYYFEISLFLLVLTLCVVNVRIKRNERYDR